MAYAEVDLRDGSVRYACAGHPPPGRGRTPTGGADLLWDGRSTPLGAALRGGRPRSEATVDLRRGSRLVLYTDGLVERRDQPLDEGIDALAELLGSWAHRPLDTLADGVTDAVLGTGRTGDDVCLLALGYREHPTFSRAVPADTALLSPLRADLTHWLQTHGVTGEDHDATLLACSEAVANAIEHGYPEQPDGVVDVLATIGPGQLRIRIRDRGRWRPSVSSARARSWPAPGAGPDGQRRRRPPGRHRRHDAPWPGLRRRPVVSDLARLETEVQGNVLLATPGR